MKQSYWYSIVISVLLLFLVGYGQYSVRQWQQEIKLNQVRNQFELTLIDRRYKSERLIWFREEIKNISPTPSLSDLYDVVFNMQYQWEDFLVLPIFIPMFSSKYKEYSSYYASGSDYDKLDRAINDTQEFVYHYSVDHIIANGGNNYDVCLTWAFGYEQQNTGLLIHPNAPVRGPYPIDACIPVILYQGKILINQEKFQEFVKQK